jgi:CDP-glycerol glycerophosphotransferase (TagB/SpsB family)
MVFSYYLYKYPYKILWYLKKFIKLEPIAFYCADPLDFEMFQPIAKFLPEVAIIAKNKKTKDYLNARGIKFKTMPVFPKIVIMGRHEPYKFPVKEIMKIGFDHGLYQFKRWTSAKNYNAFDAYFVSSENQVENAKKLGIATTRAIGYPKLDNAFNGIYNENYLQELKDKININPDKKTIIFTSTWNIDGLSALEKWIDRVQELTQDYNILLTVHTWTEEKNIQKLKNVKNAYYIEDFDVTPYLIISDIFVGDYNSLIGEFCAFDKPIITFKVPESKREIPEIKQLLKAISIQIDEFDEIRKAIKRSLENPEEKSDERLKANKLLYLALDGKAGERAANIIKGFLSQ